MPEQSRVNTQTSEDPSAIKNLRFRVHALKEVLALPPPDWLISDVLTVGSQGVLQEPLWPWTWHRRPLPQRQLRRSGYRVDGPPVS